MTELVASADHSLYVWLAYGIALATALWLVLWPLFRQRRILREYRRRPQRREP